MVIKVDKFPDGAATSNKKLREPYYAVYTQVYEKIHVGIILDQEVGSWMWSSVTKRERSESQEYDFVFTNYWHARAYYMKLRRKLGLDK